MIINVYCGTIDSRHEIQVDDSTKLADVLSQVSQEYGVDFNRGTTNLDGRTLSASNGDLEKTFADYGVTDTCFLVNSPKSDGAHS